MAWLSFILFWFGLVSLFVACQQQVFSGSRSVISNTVLVVVGSTKPLLLHSSGSTVFTALVVVALALTTKGAMMLLLMRTIDNLFVVSNSLAHTTNVSVLLVCAFFWLPHSLSLNGAKLKHNKAHTQSARHTLNSH